MATVAPLETDVNTVLRNFLLSIIQTGIDVVKGQVNRVPEPKNVNFIIYWPLRRVRIETNVDKFVDTRFIGSIVDTVLTVTAITYGSIDPGKTIFGVGMLDGTTIVSQTSGTPGGVGVYVINKIQTLAPEIMAAGVEQYLQPVALTYQLDVHGPNSADNAQIISTLWRDDFGVRAFAALSPDVAPLYTDDPKQIPFVNAESQYEDRWVIEAVLQANEVVTLPQQGAEQLVTGLINVDVVYPP